MERMRFQIHDRAILSGGCAFRFLQLISMLATLRLKRVAGINS